MESPSYTEEEQQNQDSTLQKEKTEKNSKQHAQMISEKIEIGEDEIDEVLPGDENNNNNSTASSSNTDAPKSPYSRRITPNEVFDFLFIGDEGDSKNLKRLEELKIGYIINLANGNPNEFPEQFKYLQILIDDWPFANIRQYFDKCFEFIEKCREENSRVLVHCHMGLSRSATICVAYVMKRTGWTLKKSYDHVWACRGMIMPNNGFFNQLVKYEHELYGTTTLQPQQSLLFMKIVETKQGETATKQENKEDNLVFVLNSRSKCTIV